MTNYLTTTTGIIHKTASEVTKTRGTGRPECRSAKAQPVYGWISADKNVENVPEWERLCPKCFK